MFDPVYVSIHDWDFHKFPQVPKGYWNDITNQRAFLDQLAKRLQITDQDGWYNVTQTTFKKYGASALLELYRYSPSAMLSAVFPEYQSYVTSLFVYI